MTPKATAQGDPKAASRARNVERAEQRIQSGRAYTQASVHTAARAGVNIGALLAKSPGGGLPGAQAGPSMLFQSTLHKQVQEQNHQTQLQALRHALTLIKQHRAQQPTPDPYPVHRGPRPDPAPVHRGPRPDPYPTAR